ncbi:MAG: DUF1622 domain-containing protein [Lachnospiraceae bacterium]
MYYLYSSIILAFELTGVGIIIVAGIRGFYSCVTHKPDTKLALAKGLALGLEFKLGSEILRTVIFREWTEIATVAGIIILRAALTFLIHWEIKEEEKGISVD